MGAFGRVAIALLIGALTLTVALGTVALATRPAAIADFAPFTMRVTWWTSNAVQRQGSPAEPGTAVQLLDYRSIDSWRLTVVSSTWDPTSAGTAIEVTNRTHSTLLAHTGRLVSRVIAADEGKMAPYRWLIPGLVDELDHQGFVRLANSPAGTVTLLESSANTVVRPDGTTDVVTGTIVVFDSATRLPQNVATYRDGVLRQSLRFELLGRS